MNPRTRRIGWLLAVALFLFAGSVLLLEQERAPRRHLGVSAHDNSQAKGAPLSAASSGTEQSRVAVAMPQGTSDGAGTRNPESSQIRGQVVDALSGSPVVRFRLFLCAEGEAEILARAEEDPSLGLVRHDPLGRFTLADLSPGTYSVLVDPEVSGYERTVIHGVLVPDGSLLRARVGRGAHVEGHVLDAEGRPAANLEVLLGQAGSEAIGGEARTHTGADGGFLFTRLEPGSYRLTVLAAEPRELPPFRVGANLRVEREVVLDGASVLNVRVQDEDGQPLPGSRVLVAGRCGVILSARADGEGEARIDGLSDRRYALQVVRPGYRTQSLDVELFGDHELAVELLATRH